MPSKMSVKTPICLDEWWWGPNFVMWRTVNTNLNEEDVEKINEEVIPAIKHKEILDWESTGSRNRIIERRYGWGLIWYGC